MKKLFRSLFGWMTPQFLWLYAFLSIALAAPTDFAKALLVGICVILVWAYVFIDAPLVRAD